MIIECRYCQFYDVRHTAYGVTQACTDPRAVAGHLPLQPCDHFTREPGSDDDLDNHGDT